MDPFIGLLIIVLIAKAALDKGRREYRATREQHAAQIARDHPDWHPRKVSRSAGRRALSHWWNELAAWPPFPSLRAAFAEERMTAKVAREEARADGVVRWKELRERLQQALAAQAEHPAAPPAHGEPEVPATPEVPPLPSETVGPQPGRAPVPDDDPVCGIGACHNAPRPGRPFCAECETAIYAPRPAPKPRDSSWLEPHEERCEACGGTGGNADGTDSCPVCRGWGSKPPDPDAPPWWHGTPCRACGNPGTADDPVVSASQIHRSHVVEAQARYQDALARQRQAAGDGEHDDDPFPEPEDGNWPTGVPHRRNGDAPSPAANGGNVAAPTRRLDGEPETPANKQFYDDHGTPFYGNPAAGPMNGGTAMPAGAIDTALEGADTPHEAMQGAFRQIGARAAEFAQAASDELAAAAAVHGMDRDPQTMADIAGLADHAQALQAQANAAATGLASRHAEGAEYHSTGTDANASAYRPS